MFTWHVMEKAKDVWNGRKRGDENVDLDKEEREERSKPSRLEGEKSRKIEQIAGEENM